MLRLDQQLVRKTSLTGPSVQETPTIDLTRLISLLWYLVCLSVMIGQTIGWKVYCNKLRAHIPLSVCLKYADIVLHKVFSGIMIKIKWHWNILIVQRNLFRLDSNPQLFAWRNHFKFHKPRKSVVSVSFLDDALTCIVASSEYKRSFSNSEISLR